jgi:hypothetical protein
MVGDLQAIAGKAMLEISSPDMPLLEMWTNLSGEWDNWHVGIEFKLPLFVVRLLIDRQMRKLASSTG